MVRLQPFPLTCHTSNLEWNKHLWWCRGSVACLQKQILINFCCIVVITWVNMQWWNLEKRSSFSWKEWMSSDSGTLGNNYQSSTHFTNNKFLFSLNFPLPACLNLCLQHQKTIIQCIVIKSGVAFYMSIVWDHDTLHNVVQGIILQVNNYST